MSLVSIEAPSTPIPDLYLASVGFVIVLIFGTQKNVIVSLTMWLRDAFSASMVWLKAAPRKIVPQLKLMFGALKFWRNRGIKGDRGFIRWRGNEKIVDLAA